MTDANGIRVASKHLKACKSMDELRRIWEGIAVAYQHEPEVQAVRDRMKGVLS